MLSPRPWPARAGLARRERSRPLRAIPTAISILALATLGMAAVGGCSAGVSPVKRPPPGTGQGTEAADSAALASGAITGSSVAATEMEVTIGSGPDTGSHRAESSSVTCTYGLSALGDDAEDSFGNQFADDSSAGLSALELIVPDTKQASARGTEAFMLSIRIGKPAKAHRYRINSLPDRYGVGSAEGSGELRLDDDGAVGVLSVRGTTSDGIPVEALIRCNSILDADGQPRD